MDGGGWAPVFFVGVSARLHLHRLGPNGLVILLFRPLEGEGSAGCAARRLFGGCNAKRRLNIA